MLKIVIALETSSSWEEAMAPVNRMRFVSLLYEWEGGWMWRTWMRNNEVEGT